MTKVTTTRLMDLDQWRAVHVSKAMTELELYMNMKYGKGCDVMRDGVKLLLVDKTWKLAGYSFLRKKKHVEVRGV